MPSLPLPCPLRGHTHHATHSRHSLEAGAEGHRPHPPLYPDLILTKRLRIRWRPSERVSLWAVGLGFYRW